MSSTTKKAEWSSPLNVPPKPLPKPQNITTMALGIQASDLLMLMNDPIPAIKSQRKKDRDHYLSFWSTVKTVKEKMETLLESKPDHIRQMEWEREDEETETAMKVEEIDEALKDVPRPNLLPPKFQLKSISDTKE
jgi:hypothetical protein